MLDFVGPHPLYSINPEIGSGAAKDFFKIQVEDNPDDLSRREAGPSAEAREESG
jgi:hypothetical protein